jgi:hypothetical protein
VGGCKIAHISRVSGCKSGSCLLTTAATPSSPIPVIRFRMVVTKSGTKMVPVWHKRVRNNNEISDASDENSRNRICMKFTWMTLILIPVNVS